MKTRFRVTNVVSFLLGATLGAIMMFLLTSDAVKGLLKSHQEELDIQDRAYLALMERRTDWAYFEQETPVALWELNQLLEVYTSLNNSRYGRSEYVEFGSFLCHARLAKIYQEASMTDLAGQHIEEASKIYNRLYPDSKISSWETLQVVLEEHDKVARKGLE